MTTTETILRILLAFAIVLPLTAAGTFYLLCEYPPGFALAWELAGFAIVFTLLPGMQS